MAEQQVPEEPKLRAALLSFYQSRQHEDKLKNLDRIVQRYAGGGVLDLWQALGEKYSLPQSQVVLAIAETLDLRLPVQWPSAEASDGAHDVLQSLPPRIACFDEEDRPSESRFQIAAALNCALEKRDDAAVACIAFRCGCPDPKLRALVWRRLLLSPRAGFADGDESSLSVEDAAAIGERRLRYNQLRARVMRALGKTPTSALIPVVVEAEISKGGGQAAVQDAPAPTSAVIRAMVEAEVAAAWPGKANGFFQRPEVADTVEAIASTYTHLRSKTEQTSSSWHTKATCLIVAVLLFVMTCEGAVELACAEAEVFWCLFRMASELRDGAGRWAFDGYSSCVQEMLRTYDPPLAARLMDGGPAAIGIAAELGYPLLLKAGFRLTACLRIWDTILADPCRGEVHSCFVVAMLLVSRGQLLEDKQVMEKLVQGVPCHVELRTLFQTTFAVCALDRRRKAWGPNQHAQGSRGDLEAGPGLSALWGRVRTVGADAWEAGRSAATRASNTKAPGWLVSQRAAVAEVVSDVVASAASAAESASEALEAVLTFHHSGLEDQQELPGTAVVEEAQLGPSDLKPHVPRVVLSPVGDAQTILTEALAENLADHLPIALRIPGAVEWILKYTPKAHGVSLSTLYRNLEGHSKTIVIIQDSDGQILGGFAPAAWEPRSSFYGSGDAFVFSCSGEGEDFECRAFPWTTRNSMIMYSDTHLFAMGGDDGHHAWAVYSDLLHGSSSPTVTFGNPRLVVSEELVVRDLEVWALADV